MLYRDHHRMHIEEKDKSARSFVSGEGSVSQFSPVEQLPFPDPSPFPPHIAQAPWPQNAGAQEPTVAVALQKDVDAAVDLPDAVQQAPTSGTSSLRKPVIIHGSGKKSRGTLLAPRPQGRRVLVHASVSLVCVFVVLSVLITILPAGNGQAQGLARLFAPFFSLTRSKDSNTALIAAQQATATAVTQDGFDPGGGHTYAGVPTAPAVPITTNDNMSDAAHLNRFFYGQCTYWANMRYHQLTGNWVTWLGNANAWAYQAPAYGWTVSNLPNPNGPSIIVLQSDVQNSGYYGHVAVVEKINGDGTVLTSNWNWRGWAVYSEETFRIGPGVSFIWK